MDYRFKWWIENTGSYYILSKYNTSKRGPMLKVSEMYLILAETASSVSEKEEWLNTLLYHRGLPNENLSDVDVNSRLLQEYAKEFIGEGQIFFAYKGLNCNKTPVTNTTVADPETPINLRRSILRQAYQSFTAKVKTGRKKAATKLETSLLQHLCCGGRIRTCDLQVMSLASYQLLHSAMLFLNCGCKGTTFF